MLFNILFCRFLAHPPTDRNAQFLRLLGSARISTVWSSHSRRGADLTANLAIVSAAAEGGQRTDHNCSEQWPFWERVWMNLLCGKVAVYSHKYSFIHNLFLFRGGFYELWTLFCKSHAYRGMTLGKLGIFEMLRKIPVHDFSNLLCVTAPIEPINTVPRGRKHPVLYTEPIRPPELNHCSNSTSSFKSWVACYIKTSCYLISSILLPFDWNGQYLPGRLRARAPSSVIGGT